MAYYNFIVRSILVNDQIVMGGRSTYSAELALIES
jgi:translation initiation factor 6 (eIF-6)